MKNRHVIIREKTVIKRFYDAAWGDAEARSYDELNRLVEGASLSDGWTLRAPKVLHRSPTEIEMTKVPGIILNRVIGDASPLPWQQIGQALALFHDRVGGTPAETPLYSDIGVGNVLVAESTREISLIDPGVNFGTIGPVTQDLTIMLWAIFSARLRHRRLLKNAERQFLSGYCNCLSESRLQALKGLLNERGGMRETRDKLHTRWRNAGFRGLIGRLCFALWASLIFPRLTNVSGPSDVAVSESER